MFRVRRQRGPREEVAPAEREPVEHLDDAISNRRTTDIEDQVTSMFAEIPGRLDAATRAFLAGDRVAAQRVIEADEAIDALQIDIEDLVQAELLGDQWTPGQLRYLITVLRIVPELERSADLIEHIALRSQPVIAAALSPRARDQVAMMGRAAVDMWQMAATAYLDRTPGTVEELRARDDILDGLHVDLTHELARGQLEAPIAIELGLVARFFERLGDHAVNVARRLDYMTTSEGAP
jgi:phosphate transport system protein